MCDKLKEEYNAGNFKDLCTLRNELCVDREVIYISKRFSNDDSVGSSRIMQYLWVNHIE